MFRPTAFLALALMTLVACDEVSTTQPPGAPPPASSAPVNPTATGSGGTFTQAQAVQAFRAAKTRMEPVMERECKARTRGVNCDFKIAIASDPNLPPNAYQSYDKSLRPEITFTLALLEGARNVDEVAFIMGHEGAHHIEGHIERAVRNANAVSVIFAGTAILTGADTSAVQSAAEIGGLVGARSYSKEYELEADRLGTVLTIKGGYDPILGSQYFNRIPDPGNRFLGSHPPNAQRLQVVRQTASQF